MNKLSPSLEHKLLEAVDGVSMHVNNGETPTDALFKVASDLQLMPPFIRLVGNSYNTGEAAMRRESSSVLEKLASFPLADADDAIQRIYGDEKAPNQKEAESSVSGDYDTSPQYTRLDHARKTASAHAKSLPALELPPGYVSGYAPDYGEAFGKKYATVHKLRSSLESSKQAVLRAKREWETSLQRLRGYFKQASFDRAGVGEVENRILAGGGDPFLTKMMDYVHYHSCPSEPRHSEKQASLMSKVDWNERPYDLVKEADDKANAYAQALIDHRYLFKDVVTKSANLLAGTPGGREIAPVSPVLGKIVAKPKQAQERSKEASWYCKEAFESLPTHSQRSLLSIAGPEIVNGCIGANNDTPMSPYTDLELPKKASTKKKASSEDTLEGDKEISIVARSPLLREKAAIGILGMTFASTMANKLKEQQDAQDKFRQNQIQDFQDKLADPVQSAKLRQLRAQANLNALMASDPVLQNHSPEEVSQAYNEVVGLTPRAAEQAMVLRPMLRKRLEQEVLEPFESTEALKAEKGIAATQENPSLKLDES